MKNNSKILEQTLWAIFMLVGGLFIVYQLSEIEANGGSFRMPSIMWFVYEKIGKWGVFGIFIFAAGVCFTDIPYANSNKYVRRNNSTRTPVRDKKGKEKGRLKKWMASIAHHLRFRR
jgi:hypothetical protein